MCSAGDSEWAMGLPRTAAFIAAYWPASGVAENVDLPPVVVRK